jgi:hypothetical protein
MNTMHMLVATRMADRLREADNERLGRLATRPRPTPAPRNIPARHAARGEVLRPADDSRGAKVAERPA